jgi:hypothetical protein
MKIYHIITLSFGLIGMNHIRNYKYEHVGIIIILESSKTLVPYGQLELYKINKKNPCLLVSKIV